MIDIEAEARAIHQGKHEAWDAAVHKLCQAWDSGDQAAIGTWQRVFGRYLTIASRSRTDDGFYDLNVYMDAGQYAGGLDPRTEELTDAERAERDEDDAAFLVEIRATHPDPQAARDPDLDDDIPF